MENQTAVQDPQRGTGLCCVTGKVGEEGSQQRRGEPGAFKDGQMSPVQLELVCVGTV